MKQTHKKEATAYLLRCLSALHAGAGDTNYGVVDNLVQRDPVTRFPIIHGSSLKGALRQFFTYHLQDTGTEKFVSKVFGQGAGDSEDQSASSDRFGTGAFDFDFAHLLSIPARTDKGPYLSATCPEILKSFIHRLELFGARTQTELAEIRTFLAHNELENPQLEGKPLVFETELTGAYVEELDWQATVSEFVAPAGLKRLIGERMVLLSDTDFRDLVERLPVIARNHLVNGESQNLWYEEIVPAGARFTTLVLQAPSADPGNNFNEILGRNLLQVGANATVGYGKTKMTPLTL